MGYYATGGGSITLGAVPPDSVLDIGKETFGYFKYDKERHEIEVQDDEKYYEDEVTAFLRAIEPYTLDGEIYYSGEDDCHWRFVFRDGAFQCDYGEVKYDGDPAIEMKADDVDALVTEIVNAARGTADQISAETAVGKLLKEKHII